MKEPERKRKGRSVVIKLQTKKISIPRQGRFYRYMSTKKLTEKPRYTRSRRATIFSSCVVLT